MEEEHEAFWSHQLKVRDEWLLGHPLFAVISKDKKIVTPVVIFEDDVGISRAAEGRMRVLHWFSESSSLPFAARKLPLFMLPTKIMLPKSSITEDMLNEAVAWSFNVLASGRWPEQDWLSRPYAAKSWRGKRACTLLTPDSRRGGLIGVVCDWKAYVELFKFDNHWQNEDGICHLCTAKSIVSPEQFTQFVEFPKRSHDEFLLQAHHRTLLTWIRGLHLARVLPEMLQSLAIEIRFAFVLLEPLCPAMASSN